MLNRPVIRLITLSALLWSADLKVSFFDTASIALPALNLFDSAAFAQSTDGSGGSEVRTIRGSLDADSPVLPSDSSYYEAYSFAGQAGEVVVLELASNEFDAYLVLLDPQGQDIAQDDDGAGGSNARIELRLPVTGTYRVLVNSYQAGGTGAYTLSTRTSSALVAVSEEDAQIGSTSPPASSAPASSASSASTGAKAEADRFFHQGDQQFETSQFRESLQSWEQALAIYREIGDRSTEGTTLNNIGLVYDSLGQYPQALEYYQQALAIHQEVGNRRMEGTALSNIGAVLLQTNQYVTAETSLLEAVTVLESLRASELDDAAKIAIFETQANTYEGLQQVLVAQNTPEKQLKALEISERGRGRAFAERVAQQLAPQAATIAPPNLNEIKQIAQLQNATLIQYSVIDNRVSDPALYIWVISPTGDIQFQSVDITQLDRPLSELVNMSREAIGVRGRANDATISVVPNPQAQRNDLQTLYQLLIQPIEQHLPTDPNQKVVFIPQGELFLVPFPALIDAQGKYLIESHTILTAPSIQTLGLTSQLRQTNGNGTEALVVGNPIMPTVWDPESNQEVQLDSLPGAEKEADAIADRLGTKPLMWNDATEAAVVQRMQNARIIHLATHGLLEYGDPQESGVRDLPGAIALTPSGSDDGLLTSAELFQMKLNAELVVLSACDTGRGRLTGDGVVGLSRSLIQAGVPSVIVSLWQVPDAPTAELMVEFYQQWQQTGDKAQALRQAMLTTMQNHPDPRDWAAFTLIGEAN